MINKIDPYRAFRMPQKGEYIIHTAKITPSQNGIASKKYKKAIGLGVSLLAFAGATIIVKKNLPDLFKDIKADSLLENLKGNLGDLQYKRALLKGAGIKGKAPSSLNSIMGGYNYKKFLGTFSDNAEAYTPGKTLNCLMQDGFDLFGVEKGTYRANMHMHTIHSDGQLTISELLDKASEYANKVVEKNGSKDLKNAPFTIAITDHDTVEGCKEAVKIIAKNPEKYKNLRVVLGAEMSINHIHSGKKNPFGFHVLFQALNPFDGQLNKFLNDKKKGHVVLVKEIIDESTKLFNKTFPDKKMDFNYEDAKGLYPSIKHGITSEIYLSTKDYIQFKTIFSECFEENEIVQELLKTKNINPKTLNYTQPKQKYFSQIQGDFGDKYWLKYQEALKLYIADLCGITQEEAAKNVVISSKMERFLQKIDENASQKAPKNPLSSPFTDIEEIAKLAKSQKDGYMGLAHPALTCFQFENKNNDDMIEHFRDFFRTFKTFGGEKFLFVEGHYPYYGCLAKNEDFLQKLEGIFKEFRLLKTGGIDTHGTNIFYGAK